MINFIFSALYAHGGAESATQAVEQTESASNLLITMHPKLVHFPIAIIMLVLFFELLYILKKQDFFERVTHWLFYLGLLASGVALVAGLISADAIGHDSPGHGSVHEHRNIMIAASILWLIGSGLLRFWPAFKSNLRVVFRAIIIIIVALFIWGAHEGGELVYEKGVGVEPVLKAWKEKATSKEKTSHEEAEGGDEHEGSHQH